MNPTGQIDSRSVLVVGATGKLGRAIVRRLRAAGISVRALVRPTSNRAALQGTGAEVVTGDLRDAESLRGACRGCRALVTTASSLRGSTGFDLQGIDRLGNLNLIEAAKAEGMEHFVFTSTIGADAPDAPRIFKNKKVIEDRLASSGLRYTVLRPAGFMENVVPLIRWARRTGWAVLPGAGTTRTSYIAICDVAEMARLVMLKPPANPPVVEFGGDDLCLLDCAALMEEALGKRLRLLHVPWGALRFAGRALRAFTEAPDAQLEIAEFVERKGLRAEKKFLSEYPIALTSFRTFLSQELAAG